MIVHREGNRSRNQFFRQLPLDGQSTTLISCGHTRLNSLGDLSLWASTKVFEFRLPVLWVGRIQHWKQHKSTKYNDAHCNTLGTLSKPSPDVIGILPLRTSMNVPTSICNLN